MKWIYVHEVLAMTLYQVMQWSKSRGTWT